MKLSDAGALDADDVGRYWADGYLHPVRVLTVDEARSAREDLEGMERDWMDASLPLPLATYKRVNAHIVMPFAAELARHSAILDVVEGILGPDILIYSVEFFAKEPRTSHVVTMHQDLTYWGLGAIDGLVTAWLALSPATIDSGCMEFVRGSHKNPILPHNDTFADENLLSRGQEIEVDIAPEDRTPIVLMPGEMSLHHGLTIHGSGPNVSDDRRIGFVVRYIRPDMQQTEGARDFVMEARGEDRFGNFVHVPPPEHPFSQGSLELYEEIRREQAQTMMKGARKKAAMYG